MVSFVKEAGGTKIVGGAILMVITTEEPTEQKPSVTMALAGMRGKELITHLRELK